MTGATGAEVRFTHREGTVYAIVLSDLLTDDLAWTQATNGVRIPPPRSHPASLRRS